MLAAHADLVDDRLREPRPDHHVEHARHTRNRPQPSRSRPTTETDEAFRAAVEADDFDAATELLADDVVFRSPVAFKPYEGKPIVAAILRGVSRVFTDLRYVRELEDADGRGSALIFQTFVDGVSVHGMDLLRFNDDGLITEFTVMVRPLSAANALATAMAAQFPQIQAEADEGHPMTAVPAPAEPARPGPHHAAQPRDHGLDAHRHGGPRQAPARAGRVLRRARQGRRRPVGHRRVRPQLARLAAAVRLEDDVGPPRRQAPRRDRRRARARRQDRAAAAARRALRLPPVQAGRLDQQVAHHPVRRAQGHEHQGGRPHGRRLRGARPCSPGAPATTASRSWAPRAT